MAVTNPPVWIQTGGETAEIARRFTRKMFDARGGILGAADLAVAENGTPNMSVNIPFGGVLIPGTESTFQGFYYCENRGTENRAIAASDPTNPRKDLVVARVKDAAYSGVTNSWDIEVVTGTPAPSPSEPAVPANSWVLAMVDVPANDAAITNSQITDRRTTQSGQAGRAAAIGGIITCTSTSRPGHSTGRAIFETDTNRVYVSTGTVWKLVNPGIDAAADEVTAAQTTTSTTYTDLTTVGPAVSVYLEAGQKALVTVSARLDTPASLMEMFMSFAVSGTETVAANDGNAARETGNATVTLGNTITRPTLFTASGAAGSRTFTAKYRTTAGTPTFRERRIFVEPK